MPWLLWFYLGKRLFLGTALVQIALTVPVVLSALFHQLPPAAMRGGLIWPAIVGTLPTVTYIALPISVGVACALEFARWSSEGMVAVFYSLRLSPWAICAPAIVVAMIATALGYAMSCWAAPAYSGSMHDVINVIRHSLNHRLLEAGHFYTFEDEQRTIYFEKWETPDQAKNVFIRQHSDEKKSEETVVAEKAEFRRNANNVIMILIKGSVQSRPDSGDRVRVANFEEYAISLPMQGSEGLPGRNWQGMFELSTPVFLDDFDFALFDKRILAEWMSEAAKRFALPLLAMAHTLLGVGLVLAVGSATGRRSMAASAIIAVLPAVHVGILIATETLIRANPFFVIAIVGMIVAEAGFGAWLITRQQSGGARHRSAAPARLATATG